MYQPLTAPIVIPCTKYFCTSGYARTIGPVTTMVSAIFRDWVGNEIALTRRHIIHYIPRKKTPYIIYTRERQEKNRLALTREIYEDRKKSYTTRIKAMIEYATADDKCRSRMLLRYFGEKNEHNCGQCDVCLNNHHSGIKQGEFQELEQQIKQLLQAGAMPASELLNQLNSNREKAEKVLSYLLSEEIIQLKNGILSV